MGKGKDKFSVKLREKLNSLSNTIESIQKVGMWVNFHKKHAEEIVDVWMSLMKAANEDRKLTLVYLANEVLQTCKRKEATIYREVFRGVLLEVAGFFDKSQIKKKVERVFEVWQERKIFKKAFCQELKASLVKSPSDSPTDHSPPPQPEPVDPSKLKASLGDEEKEETQVNAKELDDFQHDVLLDKLRAFLNLETDTSAKFAQLDARRLDASASEAMRQLKDREHGAEFKQQFEDASVKLEEYVVALNKEVAARESLISDLRVAQVYYDTQFGDVKVVVTAYRRYGLMIEKMKQKLAVKMDSLPEEFVPSVDVEDAPSPGNTPPQLRDSRHEDIGAEVAVLSRKEEDMDMGDSDNETNNTKHHRGNHKRQRHGSDKKKRVHSGHSHEGRKKERRQHHPSASPSRSVDSAPSPPSDYEGEVGAGHLPERHQAQLKSLRQQATGRGDMVPLDMAAAAASGGGGGNTPTQDETSGAPPTPGTAMNFLSSLLPGQPPPPPIPEFLQHGHERPQRPPGAPGIPPSPSTGWNQWRATYAQEPPMPFLPSGDREELPAPPQPRMLPGMPPPPPPPPFPNMPRFLQRTGFRPPVPPRMPFPSPGQMRFRAQHPHPHPHPQQRPSNGEQHTALLDEPQPIQSLGNKSLSPQAQDPSFRPFALRGRGGFNRHVRPAGFDTPEQGQAANMPNGDGYHGQQQQQQHGGNRGGGGRGRGGGNHRGGFPRGRGGQGQRYY